MLKNDGVFFEAVRRCYDHLTAYRAIEDYCISKITLRERNGELFHPARSRELPGNLATCVVVDLGGEEIVSDTLISPSFMVSSEVREYQRMQCLAGNSIDSRIASKIHCDDTFDTGRIWISLGENLEECVHLKEEIECKVPEHSSDSEHILLNIIDWGIDGSAIPPKSLVVLATERIPCESCTDTMIRFLEKHRDAALAVVYTFDTSSRPGENSARQSQEFISQIRQSDVADRVQLQRAFTEANAIRTVVNPELRFDRLQQRS